MFWSFGTINGKLAEVYFERKKGKVKIFGHCYVKKSEYKIKKEKSWIIKDTAKVRLTFRKGKYNSTKLAYTIPCIN